MVVVDLPEPESHHPPLPLPCTPRRPLTHAVRGKMIQVINFLAANYPRQTITEERMAQVMEMALSEFSKAFNQYAGKTFARVLHEFRVQASKRMLIAGSSFSN